jgi:hypothetical protein
MNQVGSDYGRWAACGEITILEYNTSDCIWRGYISYGGEPPNQIFSPENDEIQPLDSTQWQIIGLQWTEQSIKWIYNGSVNRGCIAGEVVQSIDCSKWFTLQLEDKQFNCHSQSLEDSHSQSLEDSHSRKLVGRFESEGETRNCKRVSIDRHPSAKANPLGLGTGMGPWARGGRFSIDPPVQSPGEPCGKSYFSGKEARELTYSQFRKLPAPAPFDRPFYLVVELAADLNGGMDIIPIADEAELLVDWVKLYHQPRPGTELSTLDLLESRINR